MYSACIERVIKLRALTIRAWLARLFNNGSSLKTRIILLCVSNAAPLCIRLDYDINSDVCRLKSQFVLNCFWVVSPLLTARLAAHRSSTARTTVCMCDSVKNEIDRLRVVNGNVGACVNNLQPTIVQTQKLSCFVTCVVVKYYLALLSK